MSTKAFVDNVQSPLIQRRSEKELQGLPLSSAKLFTDEGFQFHPLPTLWLAVLQEVLVIVFFCFLFIPRFSGKKLEMFQLQGIVHGCFLFLFVVINRFTELYHSRARKRGYLRFYKRTEPLVNFPVAIWAVGNTILLFLVCLWPSDAIAGKQLIPTYILQAVTGLELLTVTINTVIYIC